MSKQKVANGLKRRNSAKVRSDGPAWREFGAFSYSKCHVPNVIRYIQNQEIHHRKETFIDEYRRMLKLFGVECDEKYIFKEPAWHKTFLRNELQFVHFATHEMFLRNKWNLIEH